MNIEHLRQWVGRSETHTDQITAAPMAALAATLDLEAGYPLPGDLLPPLWHWLYFLPLHRQSELGPDGHAARGGFLPPVDLPRRMWAGGRLEFVAPLRVGESVTRTSEIVDVSFKEGRSGPLVFVLVRHEIHNASGLAITEEHDIVYRDHARPGSPAPATRVGESARWERTIRADDVLLFRYSALTFNGHRIHYDRRYATEAEHYPGLVVHGPLLATLLVDLVRRNLPRAHIAGFEFRALAPVYDMGSFTLRGNPADEGATVRLWVRDSAGVLAMEAAAAIAQ